MQEGSPDEYLGAFSYRDRLELIDSQIDYRLCYIIRYVGTATPWSP
jgi:hypothetical protein